MSKQAISVTLDPSNLLWLRAQTVSSGCRSISEMLDRLIHKVRTNKREKNAAIRSVVGTIEIAESDSNLSTADAAIRALFPRDLRHQQRAPVTKARAKREASHSTLRKHTHA